MQQRTTTLLLFVLLASTLAAQPFYLGADLSYVNEMEDCGVVYQDGGVAKDPYAIFADYGANLVRIRLWHTPNWYDALNSGQRYSDLADVKKSIARAKQAGMAVLLDFHLSDTWADPGRQIVPAAWAGVVDQLPLLQDSLYNYVHGTMMELAAEDLLPTMVQVGNETNKGILQSAAADAAGWALDWPRNAALFNRAIRAIRDVETATGQSIEIALHIAGPNNAGWLTDGFTEYGVTDYDVLGLSYYWAWHQPLTIAGTGDIITQLKTKLPGKDIMIFETGYIWTTASNDQANNIISSVQAGYSPASPTNQRRWLIDLTKEVLARGGSGVVYWEPAWVSSDCFTQWGRGSHQEHATFFDFDSNVLPDGGMGFYGYDYQGTTSTQGDTNAAPSFEAYPLAGHRSLAIRVPTGVISGRAHFRLYDTTGRTLLTYKAAPGGGEIRESINIPEVPTGIYFLELRDGGRLLGVRRLVIGGN